MNNLKKGIELIFSTLFPYETSYFKMENFYLSRSVQLIYVHQQMYELIFPLRLTALGLNPYHFAEYVIGEIIETHLIKHIFIFTVTDGLPCLYETLHPRTTNPTQF